MIKKRIRVHRQDSAFVYAILESLEGMASYSTLGSDFQHQQYRDLELFYSEDFSSDLEKILEGLRKKFQVLEIEL